MGFKCAKILAPGPDSKIVLRSESILEGAALCSGVLMRLVEFVSGSEAVSPAGRDCDGVDSDADSDEVSRPFALVEGLMARPGMIC